MLQSSIGEQPFIVYMAWVIIRDALKNKGNSFSLLRKYETQMMKSILLVTAVIMVSGAFAQDIITLKTGEQIKARIIEVGVTEIKFKRFEMLEGPLHIVPKADVRMILYENGMKEEFGNKQPEHSYGNYETLMQQYRHRANIGTGLLAAGGVMIGTSLGLFIYSYSLAVTHYSYGYGSSYSNSQANAAYAGTVFLFAAVPFVVTGIVQLVKASHYKKRALKEHPALPFPQDSKDYNF